MIKTLQKKFIKLASLSLLAVILFSLLLINGVFLFHTFRRLNQRLNEPPFAMPGPENTLPFLPKKDFLQPKGSKELQLFNKRMLFELRDGEPVFTGWAEPGVSQDELRSLALSVLAQNKTTGWYGTYRYRLIPAAQSRPDMLCILDAYEDLYAVFSVFLISLGIGLFCFLLFLFLIVLFSERAIAPIAEGYQKQKQFITDASHELKTPLTTISAGNELSKLTYGESEYFDSIDKQVEKLHSLVKSLITLARMDEEQTPVFSSFSLSDAVYDTVNSFQTPIKRKNLILSDQIAEDLHFLGDESKIRQMVSLLMDNAIKYSPVGGTITVLLQAENGPKEKSLCLTMTNTCEEGSQIDTKQIFERFYRSDKARTYDGGFGLGLSIVQSIVALHKGTADAKLLPENRLQIRIRLMSNLPASGKAPVRVP